MSNKNVSKEFLVQEGLEDYKSGILDINNDIKRLSEDIPVQAEKIIDTKNPNIIKSERFGILDFSKSDEEFREKNKEFFEKLEDVYNINILTNNGDIDYYSLIQFFDKDNNEYIIPLPVFEDITGNKKIDDNLIDYPYTEENIIIFFKEKFNIKIDDFEERYDYDEDYKEYDEVYEEATIEQFKEGLLKSPYYNYHDGSMGKSESYISYTIITEDGEEIQLHQSESISSNYAHSDTTETSADSTILQILQYLYGNEEINIKSIKYEEHDESNWGQDYDYTHHYEKEFAYSEVKDLILESAKEIVDGVDDDIIANLAVKHVEKIENNYFEKMKNKFIEILGRTPRSEGHVGSLGENEYLETIKLIYANGAEFELDTEGEYGSNYAHTETQYYEAEPTKIQIDKIIKEKGNPEKIYLSIKDLNTWQGQLQKDDFDGIEFKFDEIKDLF